MPYCVWANFVKNYHDTWYIHISYFLFPFELSRYILQELNWVSDGQDDQDIDESYGYEDGDEVVIGPGHNQGDVLLRFHLVLKQNWDQSLADNRSDIFAQTSTRIQDEAQKLFRNVKGKQDVILADFRWVVQSQFWI